MNTLNNRNAAYRRLVGIVFTVAFILLIPLIAMQFTEEVNWDLLDFGIMGILLLCTGLLCELAFRRVKNVDYRTGIIAVILIIFFLVWAELAVGIIGTPFAGS